MMTKYSTLKINVKQESKINSPQITPFLKRPHRNPRMAIRGGLNPRMSPCPGQRGFPGLSPVHLVFLNLLSSTDPSFTRFSRPSQSRRAAEDPAVSCPDARKEVTSKWTRKISFPGISHTSLSPTPNITLAFATHADDNKCICHFLLILHDLKSHRKSNSGNNGANIAVYLLCNFEQIHSPVEQILSSTYYTVPGYPLVRGTYGLTNAAGVGRPQLPVQVLAIQT